jgi:Xaa-Pro aminopeptidase
MPIPDAIPAAEFAARRKKLLALLKGSVGLVFGGEYDPHLNTAYRPHPHFEYLTGVVDEPGALLLLDPANPVEARRVLLFLKPLNPELEQWDGLRLPVSKALKDATGVSTIYRTTALPRFLGEAVKRSRRMACLHPLALHTAPLSPDLEVFKRVAERIPGASIEDRSTLIPEMRAVKSKAELAMIQRAIDITAVGFDAILKSLKPGLNEFDVQETIEHAYRTHGARALAFRTIAGSGVNATVLHYHANNRTLENGDLICIDSGAAFQGYSADVTRTLPVSGRFSPRQREVYEVVLKANQAAIHAARAGATLHDVDLAARQLIDKAGYADFFIHSIGHHLGLETHDASPDAPLSEGAVITIEPGIYMPQERIGVRIEDDIVVGKAAAKVLTAKIPKSVAEIESAMRR